MSATTKPVKKVSDLSGPALDWAVAKCRGESLDFIARRRAGWHTCYPYSSDWSLAGPIIEREGIDLFTEKSTPTSWVASVARRQNGRQLVGWRLHQYGPAPLIAAMRCYVASKLGDTVEIPEELV